MENSVKKILLIEPPYYRLYKNTYIVERYPLGLGYLASAIKQESDWQVIVYNADFYPHSESARMSYMAGEGFSNYLTNLNDLARPIWKEIASTVAEYMPLVVGISTKSQNFKSACMVARIVKQINPHTTVIVGGPHPSMVGKVVLDCLDIDIGVKGEGERTIVELLHAISSDEKLDDINGIVYRKNGTRIQNPPREYISDLDSIGFPYEIAAEVLKDYHLYPRTAFMNIFAVRGCPFNCSFCGSREIWSRKVRFRSLDHIAREIEGLQKMGINLFNFDDDTFGVNKQYIRELCNILISRFPKIKWGCEIHVKLVDDETISLMKKAGCYYINMGIESGNNTMLQAIRKNITIEEALSACRIIRKHGLDLRTFFMVGFPQETEETLHDTIVAMKKSKSSLIVYSIFTPYPGTEMFRFCKEKGLIGPDYDVALYNHQSPLNCFCMNFDLNRFREIVTRLERAIDRANAISRYRRLFSSHAYQKLKILGIHKSITRVSQLLLGR